MSYHREQPEPAWLIQSQLPDGKIVSTCRLKALQHAIDLLLLNQFSPEPFESLVFPDDEDRHTELDRRRYRTKTEAIEGHAELVAKWSGRLH